MGPFDTYNPTDCEENMDFYGGGAWMIVAICGNGTKLFLDPSCVEYLSIEMVRVIKSFPVGARGAFTLHSQYYIVTYVIAKQGARPLSVLK